MHLFDFDGPVFQFLVKAADLLWLNILTVLCCIPVITFGPALKALAMMSIRMSREEEGNITRAYFRYFKDNFLQTVSLGIIVLFALIAMVGGVYSLLYLGPAFHIIIKIGFVIVSLLVCFTFDYIFIFQARFTNKIKDTIKLSFMAAIIYFPKTLMMFLAWAFVPACVLFISGNFLPVVFLYGLSLPMYLSALFLKEIIRELEEKAK